MASSIARRKEGQHLSPIKVVKMVETGNHRILLIVKAAVDVIKKANVRRQILSAFRVAKLDISPVDVRIQRLVVVQLKVDRWHHKVHFNMMAVSSHSGQHNEERSCSSSCMPLRKRSGTTSIKKAGLGGSGESTDPCNLMCSEKKEEEWYEDLLVDGHAVIHFKLDSGATCNVLLYELYSRVCLNGGSLEPGPRVRNYSAKGGYFNVLGVYKGRVVRKGVTYALRFVVVNELGQPAILGLPACKLM